MTDADVDGAHIATLLMTFFFQEMPGLVRDGRLYLAQPPLYRLASGGTVAYARDDAHRAELMRTIFKGKKVEVGRFKGLGEMASAQLQGNDDGPGQAHADPRHPADRLRGARRRPRPRRPADGPPPRTPLRLHPGERAARSRRTRSTPRRRRAGRSRSSPA